MRQHFYIQPTAPDNDRGFPTRMNLGERSRGKLSKLLRAHLLQDRHRADQMVRRLGERSGARLGVQQIESAIDLKCIGTDNFGIELLRNIGRDFRFSGRGRADDEECAFHR